tara:strand:+ start:360 stop:602 length:243 start_codon:yes stop_codon:yes gene_type:complete
MLDTLSLLQPIFQEVFDDDDLIIELTTAAKDVDGWDSLAHIRLVVAIERALDMRFSASEISDLENVGEMCELIISKSQTS